MHTQPPISAPQTGRLPDKCAGAGRTGTDQRTEPAGADSPRFSPSAGTARSCAGQTPGPIVSDDGRAQRAPAASPPRVPQPPTQERATTHVPHHPGLQPDAPGGGGGQSLGGPGSAALVPTPRVQSTRAPLPGRPRAPRSASGTGAACQHAGERRGPHWAGECGEASFPLGSESGPPSPVGECVRARGAPGRPPGPTSAPSSPGGRGGPWGASQPRGPLGRQPVLEFAASSLRRPAYWGLTADSAPRLFCSDPLIMETHIPAAGGFISSRREPC